MEKTKTRGPRIRKNRGIYAPQVRVVDENGGQVGVMATRDAIHLAEERGLDLVEIAPQASPPVCKIIDYGKFLYLIKKQERDARKKQTVIKLHEMKFGVRTEDHDIGHKIKKIEEFLNDGDKVKTIVLFKGRETQYKDLGIAVLHKVQDRLKEMAVVEQPLKHDGRMLFMIFGPAKSLTSKKK